MQTLKEAKNKLITLKKTMRKTNVHLKSHKKNLTGGTQNTLLSCWHGNWTTLWSGLSEIPT